MWICESYNIIKERKFTIPVTIFPKVYFDEHDNYIGHAIKYEINTDPCFLGEKW